MTRREQDRSLLRAFGQAARQIMSEPNEAMAEWRHERAFVRAADRPTLGNRRNRAYARHYAHSLATAWGL